MRDAARRRAALAPLALALALTGAARAAPLPTAATATTTTAKTATTTTASVDEVARVLAGLPVPASSALAAVAARKGVIAHGKVMDAAWTKHTAPTLAAMATFAASELADVGEQPVFYPFGGPDILNAVALAPRATTYTLLGLEPVGLLPSAALFDDPRVLDGVQRALSYVLRYNHFITDDMAARLQGRAGVAALLAFFLVRTGHTIVDARLVTVGADGSVVADEAAGNDSAAGRVRGVELVVRRPGSDREQRVRYFAGNINDDFFRAIPGLVPHLLSQGTLTTVLKAASYLMYYPAFDDVRALVLSRSGVIVTDTSGLPFHRLEGPTWALSLYGTYVAPIRPYADRCQPELKAALQKQARGPLPFPYGYDYPGHNHLIVARRAAGRPLEEPAFDGTKWRGENTLCVEGRVRVERSR